MVTLDLPTEADTARLARIIAAHLRPVDCLTLTGNIGAGKTTLMRYVIGAMMGDGDWGLGIGGQVISPSFMIMQEYDVGIRNTEHGTRKTTLYHIDGYRLNDASEIPELGLEECFESGIVAIEWPELFAGWLPHNRLDIVIELQANNQRRVTLHGRESHANTAFAISQEFHGNT